MVSTALFWLVALALVAATLFVLARPLLRGGQRADGAPPEMDAATAVYRDQKRQLDVDLAAGAITAVEHATAQEEIVHRLGAEIASRPGPAPAENRTPWIAVVALVAVIPAASLVLYQLLGSPAAMKVAQVPHEERTQFSDEDVRAMVDKLAQRMRANPDDPKGWILLGRSYAALGRFSESSEAFQEAAKRLPNDAQVYADWADSAAMAQQRSLVGKPEQLIAKALELDPNNHKALALSATVLLERGDVNGSLARWRALRQKLDPESEEARNVDRVIAEIAGTPNAAAASSAPAAPPAAPPSKSPAAKGGGALAGRIEIDPKIASSAAPDDTVFVLARNADGGRVPLAVTRMHARDLPAAFHLDDSMGMVPEMKLSATPHVIVEARVSKTGNAIASAGDLRGRSATVAPGDSNVRIVIDEIVP